MRVHYRVEYGRNTNSTHTAQALAANLGYMDDNNQKNNFKVIPWICRFGLTGARKDKDYSVKTYINF